MFNWIDASKLLVLSDAYATKAKGRLVLHRIRGPFELSESGVISSSGFATFEDRAKSFTITKLSSAFAVHAPFASRTSLISGLLAGAARVKLSAFELAASM